MPIPIFDELNVQTKEGVIADISQIRGAPRFRMSGSKITDTGSVGSDYTLNLSELTPSTPIPVVGDTVIFSTTKSSYLAKVKSVSGSNITVTVVEALGGGGDLDNYLPLDGSKAMTGKLTTPGLTFANTSTLTANGIYTRTSAGDLSWSEASRDLLINKGALAWWSGAFNGAQSNLRYCTRGEIAALADIKKNYDTVITNQSEFAAWYAQLDAGTYTGTSVLILNGTYTRSDGKGLHLPDTLKQLHGLGTVEISITNFEYSNTNKGGIWYTTPPTADKYSIENISLNCTGNGSGYGFNSCTNLTNCTGTGSSTGTGNSNSYGYGFNSCTNLTNCTGTGTGNINSYGNGSGYGFNSCTNLTNCTGTGSSTGTGNSNSYGYGFNSCTNLTNCTGTGTGSSTGGGSKIGYGFNSCKICSNCRQNPDTSSTTATWGGTNANIDYDTCPEYPKPATDDIKIKYGSISSWSRSSASTDTTYGTYYYQISGFGTGGNILSVRLTDSNQAEVIADNRRCNSSGTSGVYDCIRIYSDSTIAVNYYILYT